MNIFKKIIKSFFNISRPCFHFDNNKLNFKINSDYFYTYNLEDFDVKTRHDPYILEAYSVKSDYIFLEYIHLDEDVKFRSSPLDLYENFLKNRLRINSIFVLEKKVLGEYTFVVYKTDEDTIFYIIYIEDENKHIFLLDSRGSLYKNIFVSFGECIELKEQEKYLLFSSDISMVKYNALNSYFSN